MFIAKVKMAAAIAAVVIVTGTAVPVGIAVAQPALELGFNIVLYADPAWASPMK